MQTRREVFRLQKVLKSQLAKDEHYLLAVSGGADSLALAHCCAQLAAQGWGAYSVCHVEHGLRGAEALRDMQLVERFCAEYKLPCFVEHVDVHALADAEHLSTEDAARRLRYDALRRVAAKVGASAIVTAHHEGDQAETVLLRLLRGAGLDGLAAMRPRQGDIIRPLLELPRAFLEQYCEANSLAYCHDSTNDDTAYTRNSIRKELLPLLAERYNAEIVRALARTATLLSEDADLLTSLADSAYMRLARRETDVLTLALKQLLAEPRPIRLRVLRRAYFELGGAELSFERSQALDEACERRSGGKLIQLPGRITAVIKNKQIIFTKLS